MTTNSNTTAFYSVSQEESHLRLDEFLHKQECLMPMGAIRIAISLGNVLVNNVSRSSGWRLRANDQVVANLGEYKHLELIAEPLYLNILYEDEFLLVVNKPPSMLSHPSRYERTGTLLNGLLNHCFLQGEKNPKLGLVNRLDRDTSGVILIAKQEKVLQELARQFDQRQVKKTYQAVVFGIPLNFEGEINAAIGWHSNESRWGVDGENSRFAKTYYKVKTPINNFACLELFPYTGRTHQLRVHMSFIGHPIVGDLIYGINQNQSWSATYQTYKLPRQLLHASSLVFQHPVNKQEITAFAPLPQDMQEFLELIKGN